MTPEEMADECVTKVAEVVLTSKKMMLREYLVAAFKHAVAEERGACAQIAEAVGRKHAETVDKSHARRLVRRNADKVAAAIRARI